MTRLVQAVLVAALVAMLTLVVWYAVVIVGVVT